VRTRLPVVKPSGHKQPRNTKKPNRTSYSAVDQATQTQRIDVMATDIDKNILPQGAITDTVNGVVSIDDRHPVTVTVKTEDNEISDLQMIGDQEDSSSRDGADTKMVDLETEPISDRDTLPEIRVLEKRSQRKGAEDSWATEGERSPTARPRPNISTIDLSKEPNSYSNPIFLPDSPAEKSQCTVWDQGERSSTARPRPKISTIGLSEEPNSYSNPIFLPDSPAEKPQYTVWDEEREVLLNNWSRQTNLPGLLEVARQLPGNALFNLPISIMEGAFPRVNKENIITILDKLQPGTMLSDEVVSYASRRMAVKDGVQLLDSFWYTSSQFNLREAARYLDLVPGTRILIPCHRNCHWSCVEVDLSEGRIVHYDSFLGTGHCTSTNGWVQKPRCIHCKQVGDIFLYASRSLAPGGWKFCTPECQQQTNGVDCGIFMLAMLQRRAQKLEVDHDFSPDQRRFDIAIQFVRDILASKRKEDVIQAMSSKTKGFPFEWADESIGHNERDVTPQGTDEEECWAQFEAKHQSEGWLSQLGRLEREEHHDWIGFKGNSRLLQLAANVASPLTLIELKRQLAELRRYQPKPRFSSSPLHGAYFAGVWHDSNASTSSMCLRLISWVFRNAVVQKMTREKQRTHKRQKANKGGVQRNDKRDYQTAKKKAIDSLIKEICLTDEAGQGDATTANPSKSPLAVDARTIANFDKHTEDNMQRRIKAWYQMGGSWSRLATATGSPACLCLLPSGTNILPGQPPIYASEYRDLPMGQAELLGTLLSTLRPRMSGSFPKELYEAFLRGSPPSRRFQIESWSDDWIRNQPLDSDALNSAFQLQSEELGS